MSPARALRFCLLFCCVLLGAGPVWAAPPVVAVASNFEATLRTIAQAFERQTGKRIRLAPGATGKLYAQLRHGAPYHALYAADAQRPILLGRGDPQVEASRYTYALGGLAFWHPGAEGVTSLDILPPGTRVALANPTLAPYGRAAQQVLAGFSGKNRLATPVFGENVAQTYQFIRAGAAPAGFVAYAQVLATDQSAASYWLVPADRHDPIVQQAVLLRRGGVAEDFFRFAQSEQGRALIGAAGYDLTPEGDS